MKVRKFIEFLMDFDMDAEIVVNTDNTFYDYEEMDISCGGPNYGDSATKEDAEFIYINNLIGNKEKNRKLIKEFCEANLHTHTDWTGKYVETQYKCESVDGFVNNFFNYIEEHE